MSTTNLPITLQEIIAYYGGLSPPVNPYLLRKQTLEALEARTGRPIVCYVMRVDNRHPANALASISDDDLLLLQDLLLGIEGNSLDLFVISNGGSAEATERIVSLIRSHFSHVRFIVPFNAYSAATLLCLSGDEIIMGPVGTLGPVDPQINGIPARAILRAFEQVLDEISKKGPSVLPAYMPLLSQYNLPILEICKSAIELSQELAKKWLSEYMLKCKPSNYRIKQIVKFFCSYDIHKSHGRGIDRKTARQKGLKVTYVEEIAGLPDIVRSLCNQYQWLFMNLNCLKVFENKQDSMSVMI